MSAIEPSKTFEQRMMDRIKDSIGELMSDEDLKKIVERSLDTIFFKKPVDRYGHEIDGGRSMAEKVVQEIMKERLDLALSNWLKEHDAEVTAALQTCVNNGLTATVLNTIDRKFSNVFNEVMGNVTDQLYNIQNNQR